MPCFSTPAGGASILGQVFLPLDGFRSIQKKKKKNKKKRKEVCGAAVAMPFNYGSGGGSSDSRVQAQRLNESDIPEIRVKTAFNG